MNDFRKYATKHLGMSGTALDSYMNITSSYISPTIIEERQLNVAQMDVFSRLMMDRIIFLGTQIDDYTANVIQAQLLYLDSSDPGKDISIYINSPGGSVYAGYGIYDTMQFIGSDVSTICTGIAASMASVLLVAGAKGKRFALQHSRVMIHQPLIMGEMTGTAVDMHIQAMELERMRQELNKILSDASGQPISSFCSPSRRLHFWRGSACYPMCPAIIQAFFQSGSTRSKAPGALRGSGSTSGITHPRICTSSPCSPICRWEACTRSSWSPACSISCSPYLRQKRCSA